MKTNWNLSRHGEYEIYYTNFQNNIVKDKTNNENLKWIEKFNNSTPKSGKRMKILSEDSREKSRIIGIILAKNNDVVGASEIHILEDNKAEISMLVFWKEQIELPENMKAQSHKFERHEGIFIDELYQGKGYGTDLLKIILTYLKTLHIENLEIHGITQHGAINFYKKTGAYIINDTTAEYDVSKALKMLREKKTEIDI